MAVRDNLGGNKQVIKKQLYKTGRIEVPASTTAVIDCGFVPVHITVVVYRGSAARSNHVYDSRISTDTVIKLGQDTNENVGLPTKVSNLFSDDGKGFKINNKYTYGGWYFYYEAIGEFSSDDNGMGEA